MQSFDIDPNYMGFRSGSFRLWPWTPVKPDLPYSNLRRERCGQPAGPDEKARSPGGRS